MRQLSTLLAASGLVILTGPFSFLAQAQDYVDLEAERAAAEAAGGATSNGTSASDPYSPQPAQAYPATSYGVSGAAAAPATAPPPQAQTGATNVGALVLQVQQLQQEVMRLNGMVEEQAFQIRQLKEQSLQRYMDLDKRIGGAGAATAEPVATAPAAVVPAPARPAGGGGVEQPGEAEAYNAAYGLVRGQQFDSAVPAFQQFLRDYPDGKFAPNAHYWLGELYLVVEPRDIEAARQSFALLIAQYPGSAKAPDALYKLGKIQFEKGNREKAREYLDTLIGGYEATSPDVVRLAREFIAENY